MTQPLRWAIVMLFVMTGVVQAGEADVVAATVQEVSKGVWRFDVTVSHADEGWDHYANRFEVADEKGTVLGVRTLFHPHVDEQPFTRSLGGISIPETVGKVSIRAGDSVHETGGREVILDLSALRDQ